MKRFVAWLGVALMALAGYFAFWPIPISPRAWTVQAAPGYVGPHAQNTRLANLLGLCALTLPTQTPSCGLMLMAAPRAEARLLRLGASAERALG